MKKLLISCAILSVIILSTMMGLPALEDYLVVEKPLQHADALVVMAGETTIRLPAAAKLYKEGKADRILLTNDGIFSSWSEEKQRNLYEVEWSEEKLLKMGIPDSEIVILTYSSSGSIFDALNTWKFIRGSGIRKILIVTSDYHTKRSLWAFQRVFRAESITFGVYPVKEICNITFLRRFMILSQEIIKYMYYRVAYTDI